MEKCKIFLLHYRLNFHPYRILSDPNPGFGDEEFIQFWPTVGITVTPTRAFGYLLMGIGLLSWMAIVGTLIASGEES